ncbi:hypothetical protein F5B22DRAFT_240559 [Xylaria bambusicola]|uniref:uncharacterized protein n=1 Tax=Xylaria bambusicola TaxID=326684 RepID=UPI002007390C|nr:uncharacterized protein F5B22DRAFT_240559 [Xylaria bambusicola]KAI0514426.1 hypothetical protein F5B22DRAFT_240559 [Xylaria bambusicola]
MRFSKTAAFAIASTALAQRPEDTSICDYYTTALLKDNTADNQATLLTLVVNTVVIGNYTEPNVGVKVPGILAPGKFNATDVNLLPYFTGELASSNRGGSRGVSVNFLDGGGAEPLKKNKPANTESSAQYFLLTHLYQFFGSLLGCSKQGMPGFDPYEGHASMYEVHKFMDLDPYEVGYFISQVGLAASSFGVADSDIEVVATALNSLFGYRCAPPTTVIESQGAQLQAICIDETCPLAEEAMCDKYGPVVEPSSVPPSNSMSTTPTASYPSTPKPTGSGNTTSTSSSYMSPHPTSIPTAGAAAAGGIVAFLL